MNRTFNFVSRYGVLKKNLFGKLTDKIDKIIDVKTSLHFDDSFMSVTLYGIDRNDGEGIHNEENILYYNNINRIEFLEDSCVMNIEELNGGLDSNGKELPPSIISFIIDVEFLDDIYEVLYELENSGYFKNE